MNALAAFGPLGTPELIIIAILLLMLAIPLAVVVGVIIMVKGRKKPDQ